MIFKKGSSGWYMGKPIEQVWHMGEALFPISGSFNVLDPFNDSSTIAYYSFDDNITDLVNGHNGTSTTPLYTTGVNANALNLTGDKDQLVKVTPRLPIPDSFSISLWVQRTLPGDGWIIANRAVNDSGEKAEFQIAYYNTYEGMIFNIQTENGWFVVESSSLLYGDNFDFTYITGTVNNVTKEIKLYVNGILEDTQSFTGTRHKGSDFTGFGMIWNDSFRFHGAIDDAHFFNRALTDSEVQTLYQNMGGL